MQKTFTNGELNNIIAMDRGAPGRSFRSKKLPIKLLYAKKKNMRAVEEAFKDFEEAKNQLCQEYGIEGTVNLQECDNKEFVQKVTELLEIEVEVQVHTVAEDVLDSCGKAPYDALTYNDYIQVEWMVEGGD